MTAGGDLGAAVAELQGVPLESFVAERTRLSRELRKGGDRDAAAELAKLPKPTPPAWALNHVARESPETLQPWLDALDVLRAASEEGDGDALRSAMREHRAATTALLREIRRLAEPGGKPLSDPMVDRVRTLLGVAAGDPSVAEALRAGVVVEEPPPSAPARKADGGDGAAEESDDLAAALAASLGGEAKGASSAARPKRASKAKAKAKAGSGSAPGSAPAKPKRDRRAEARAKRRAELEERARDAIAALEPLREERERLAEAAGAAGERLEDARRDLARAENEADAADAALADADKALNGAERDLRRLQKRLDDLAP